MIKNFAGTWLVRLFCVLWAAFLFLDYINASPYFLDGYKYFEYAGLVITWLVITAGFTYLFMNRKKKGIELEIKNFRGIYHYLFTIILIGLIVLFYVLKTNLSADAVSGAMIFVFKTLFFHMGIALILLAAMSSGMFVMDRLLVATDSISTVLISIAIGFFIIGSGLFILGALGLLYSFVVISFILLLIIPGWKKTFTLSKQFLFKKNETFKIHLAAILAYAVMIFFLAINLTFDTRTFPTGYDGLNLYMNTPKLIAGYHALTQGGDAYNWSLIMSLGFIMYNNTTIAILLSVLPGVLSIFTIYRLCLLLNINRNWSLFACALFYSLPNTVWLSRIEEKVDLAMLYFTLCSVLLLVEKNIQQPLIKSKETPIKKSQFSSDTVLWTLIGLLIGFSFGIKYIAMLSIFALLVVLFYKYSGKYGAIGIFFLNFAVIFGLDLTRFAAFEKDHQLVRFSVPFALSIVAFVIAFIKNRQGIYPALKYASFFLLAIGITFLPWAIKNVKENKKVSFESMLSGKSPLPELYSAEAKAAGSNEIKSNRQSGKNENPAFPKTSVAGFGPLTFLEKSMHQLAQLQAPSDTTKTTAVIPPPLEKSTNDEKHEEIRRFLGYESGIIRFISLPYRIVMKSNVRLVTSDTGILLLIVLPVFIFGFSIRKLPWNIFKIALLFLVLALSVLSVQTINGVFNYSAAVSALYNTAFSNSIFFKDVFLPVYGLMKEFLFLTGNALLPVYTFLSLQPLGICFVLLSLFCIPLYFLFKETLSDLDTISKNLIAFVYCILQYWLVMSSGIIWYGIVGFSLVPVIIAMLTSKKWSESVAGNFLPRFTGTCSVIWFLLILPYQFIPSTYLNTKDMSKINFKEYLDPQFVKYGIGAQSEKDVLKHFFTPTQISIINTLNQNKNARVLNVSTFLNYFIVNNDSRVYLDNQLGHFQDIFEHINKDKKQLAGEFRKNNIRYILVGLNAPNIDMTPDKSLTKKFNELMTSLVNNPEVRLLHTNRLVERPDGDVDVSVNGSVVKAKYEMIGKSVIDQGTDALFEIL